MLRDMKRIGALCAAMALASCAGLNAALDYTGTPAVPFADSRDTWRIFDKPADGKLMITPSLVKSGQQGAATAATLGIVSGFLPEPIYRETAQHFLASTGRECTVLEGERLIIPQWEFRYRCN